MFEYQWNSLININYDNIKKMVLYKMSLKYIFYRFREL